MSWDKAQTRDVKKAPITTFTKTFWMQSKQRWKWKTVAHATAEQIIALVWSTYRWPSSASLRTRRCLSWLRENHSISICSSSSSEIRYEHPYYTVRIYAHRIHRITGLEEQFGEPFLQSLRFLSSSIPRCSIASRRLSRSLSSTWRFSVEMSWSDCTCWATYKTKGSMHHFCKYELTQEQFTCKRWWLKFVMKSKIITVLKTQSTS